MNSPQQDRGKSLVAKLADIPPVGEFVPDVSQPFVIFEIKDQIYLRFGNSSHAGVMLAFQAEIAEKGLKYTAFDQAMGQGFTHGEKDVLVLKIKVASGLLDLDEVNRMLITNLPAGSFLLKED